MPLEELKVVELARILAGPWAGQILTNLGADVVKIESPAGDDTRGWGPPFIDNGDGTQDAAYFHATNRGRRSEVVDFRTDEGQARIRKLVADADILIENFEVGSLEKYGLDHASLAAINPRLVYCPITGFGQDGPYAPRAGYDFIVQGTSGVMDLTGDPAGPPQKIGIAYADILTGLYAVIGIQAALAERATSGMGQWIDMALFDVMVGIAHETRFATNALRVAMRDDLSRMIAAATKGWRRDDLLAALEREGVPAGPIRKSVIVVCRSRRRMAPTEPCRAFARRSASRARSSPPRSSPRACRDSRRGERGMIRTALHGALRALAAVPLLANAPAPQDASGVAAVAAVCPRLAWVTLGTAGGPIPPADRSEPANLLIAGGHTMLVDAGDGAAVQLARYGVPLGQIAQVFLSHHHLDHTAGLSGIVGLRWMLQYGSAVTVYGPPGTRDLVDGLIASYGPQARIGFGTGRTPQPPAEALRVIELDGGDRVTVDGVTVTATRNSHFGDAGAVSLSYRFDFGGRSITYTGDTGPSSGVEVLAAGTDMLVSEVLDVERLVADLKVSRSDMDAGAFADLGHHLETHHLTPVDVGRMASRAEAGRVVLTHFSTAISPAETQDTIVGAVATTYAGSVEAALDLETFDVGCGSQTVVGCCNAFTADQTNSRGSLSR